MNYHYNKQKIFDADVKAVVKTLKSKFLTQGPETKKFENNLKKFTGSRFCVTFNSASSCLFSACKSLGLSKHDIFWTVSNTYLATVNAGLLCGSKLDFVDINEDTLNICEKKLKKKLEN